MPVPPVPVTVLVSSPEQLSELLTFCTQSGIAVEPLAATFTPTPLDTTHRKPRPLFKELCGAFWLDPKGMISPADAYTFLVSYIKNNKLRQPDGTISFDQPLQAIFGVIRAFEHELPSLALRAFPTPM